MGKQQPKPPAKINLKKRKALGVIAHKKNSQFDPEGPIGLARVFNMQKEQAMDMLISPPSEDLGLREQEAAAIDSFVTDFLNNSIAGCRFLMVPGHHGLGKSTVVHSVLQNRNIQVIKICQRAKTFRQIKQQMGTLLFNDSNFTFQVHSLKAKSIVNSLETTKIFVVENIGEIFNSKTRSQQFFQIFNIKETRRLGLIGIGGSINDLQRYVEKQGFLQKKFRNVPFEPYTNQEISKIIRSKLAGISSRLHIKIRIREQVLNMAVSKLIAVTEDLGVMLNQLKAIILPSLQKYQKNMPVYPEEDDHQRWIFDIFPQDLERIENKVQLEKRRLAKILPLHQQYMIRAFIQTINNEDLLFLSEERALQLSKSCLEKAEIRSSLEEIKVFLREIECYGLIKMEKKGMVNRILVTVGMEDIMECSSILQSKCMLLQEARNLPDQKC